MNKNTKVSSSSRRNSSAELIGLLLYDDNGNTERDFKMEFKELLKSITDLNSQPYQTDSNVHDPNNYKFNSPEFFAYFILGSVFVLPYTKIMKELNIESIYARPVKGNNEKIEAVDLCFIVNKYGKKTAKILAFTVGYSKKKVPTPIGMAVYDNKNNIDQHLAKILQDNGLNQEEIKIGEFEVSVSVGDRIDVRNKKRVISGFKSCRGYSNAQEFQKIEKINNDIYDIDEEFASIEKMTLKEKQDLSVKMIDKISSIFNLNVATFELSKSRTTYQAFVFGSMMMNFKITSKLNCFINSILGKDYSDLIFTVDHRSTKGATPLVVKFGEGEGQDIIDKMKGKGFDIAPLQLKPMLGKRILVGVSFSKNQPIKSEEVTVSQQENFFSQNYNSGLNFEINKDTIESFIKDIYYSIVDFIPSDQNELAFDQKYKNYFSRLILGQLLASNLNKDIKKWIFVPDDKSSITKIVRFALMTGVEKKRTIVFNIIEDSDQLSENILPPGIIEECLAINIQINPKNAKYGFKSDLQEEKYFQELIVEELSAGQNLNSDAGRWNIIDKKINLQALSKEERDSQTRQSEVKGSIISSLGKAINIINHFINNELNFQAVMHGIFIGTPDVVPLTEVNYSPDGRPDLALHHTNSEVPLIVVEEKFFPGNNPIEGLDKLQRAVKQIEKSKQYKAFTDAHKVIRLAMQFNKHLEKKLSYQFAGAGDVERSTESDNSIMERLFQYIKEDQYIDLKREKIEDCINLKKDGQALLHIAVSENRERIVDYLLEAKYVNVDTHNKDGFTPLHIAVDKGFIEIAKKLLKKGADLDIEDNSGKTPLMVAVDHKNIDIATTLLDAGADANSIDKNGTPILHYAIKSENYSMVKLFLSRGACFNIRSEDSTPAAFASQITPNSDIDKLLSNIRSAFRDVIYEKSVSNVLQKFKKEEVQTVLNAVDVRSNTLLYYAAKNGRENVVEELINAKANINVAGEDKSTPLHKATEMGHNNIVARLIRAGAEINVVDEYQNTPLHEAVKNNHDNVVATLLSQGATVDAQDAYGYTSIVWAVKENFQNIVVLLIKYGADVNTKYEGSKTILSLVGEYELEDMAVLLIKNGAYVHIRHYYSSLKNSEAKKLLYNISDLFESAKILNSYQNIEIVFRRESMQKYGGEELKIVLSAYDEEGKTLLHYAAKKNNEQIIEFLIGKEVDVNIKDKDGNTALHLASQEGNVDTVKLLLKKRAHFNISNKEGETPFDLSSGEIQNLLKDIHDLFDHIKDGSYKKTRAILQDLSMKNVRVILNTFDDKGKTPLHYVAENNNQKIVELFINNGAYFDVHDSEGKAPLDLAPKNSETKQWLQNIGNVFNYIKNDNYKNAIETLGSLLEENAEVVFAVHDNEDKTCFQYAIEKKYSEIVKLLIDKEIDTNAIFGNGKTPLYVAAINGNLSIVSLLIDEGADVNNKCRDGSTALHAAAEKDHINIAELLLKNGAQWYAKNNKRKTPLGLAADSSETYNLLKSINDLFRIAKNNDNQKAAEDILNGLLHEQVKIVLNLSDEKGNTCFLYAVKNNYSDVAGLFIDHGANVNAKDAHGKTASYLAVQKMNLNVLKLLIERNIFNFQYNNGQTALHFAAEVGNQDIVELLIKEEANINNFSINAKDSNGNTALHIAAERKYTNIAKLLISKGASVDVNNNNDKTPLDLAHDGSKTHSLLQSIDGLFDAAKNDDSSLIKTTLGELGTEEKFLVLNARDNEGRTSLHHAAEKGHEKSTLTLMKYGASFDAKDNQGKAPLDLAPESSKAYKLLKVVEKIFDTTRVNNIVQIKASKPEERSIVANIRDKEGRTILHYVAEKGHGESTLTLIKYGASFDAKDNQGKTPLDLAPNGSEAQMLLKVVENMFDAVESGNIFEIGGLEPEERSCIVNARDKEGRTILHHAAEKGHGKSTLTLIKYGAYVDTNDNQDKTPLDFAPNGSEAHSLLKIVKDVFDTVKTDNVLSIAAELKELEPDEEHTVLNAYDKEGKTPLHYAAEKGHKKSVMMLIGNGASVNAKDNQGKIPLDFAIEGSEAKVLLEVVKDIFDAAKVGNAHLILTKLIHFKPEERSCIVNAHDNEGRTPLHYAAQFGDEKSVVILINNGAYVDANDNQDKTPLDFATEGCVLLNNIIILFSTLRDKDNVGVKTAMKAFKLNDNLGIAVKARDSNGMTYLHYIINMSNNDDIKMVKLAIQNKADINAKDQYGNTPLHAAVLIGNVDIVKLLLYSEADIFSINNNGNTILHTAAYFGHEEIVSLLMKKDPALANAKNNNGLTPLEFISPKSGASNMSKKQQNRIIDILSQKMSAGAVGASAACLPKKSKKGRGRNRNKRELRVRRDAVWSKCLLGEDEEVDKEKTGIEINKENLAESEIDNEKLKAYQEDLNHRLAEAIAQSDENAQNLIKEEQDQLNKLILEIQEAQAISNFYMLSGEFESQEFNDKLLSVTKSVNNEAISSESLQYFKQVIKINLLKTLLPLIRDRDFKNLLLNNPEKFGQDQGLLNDIFAGIKEAISEEYEEKEELSYENFENIENKINKRVSSAAREIEHLTNQDINKSYLSNYVFRSMGLNLVLLENISDISSNLQNKICYETLVSLGALIHDHKNHINTYHNGNEHNPHMDSLVKRIKSSELLRVAHDLYYLHKSEGNVDQSELYSDQVKNKIDSYGNVNSEYKLNDIYNQFDTKEVKSYFNDDELSKFNAEFEAYNREVITIHSTQVFTSYAAIQIGIKDNIGHDKNIIIDNVGDIKNPSSFRLDEKNLVITLKLGSKEYIVTGKLEGERTKFYLNVAGYKTKIGNIISSFTSKEKGEIHNRLKQLNDKIELLESKKSIESIADTEISDESQQNIINEIKQGLLAKGVREETFNQLNEQLENMNKEVYTKHVDEVGKSLAKNNIEFDRSKFELAKIKGAKGGKFMSVLAIYDLFDSTQDLTGLKDAGSLQAIFGINGILDAMDDVRESLSTQYMRPDGKIKTSLSRNGLGKITSKIPADMRKGFVRMINNPIVQGITFATIAYQFGYSIDQIVKGENVELNAYFATSSGIKLASMSMKPTSMAVMAVTRGLGAASKVLKGLSIASNVLGKLSIVTMVADVGIATGVAIHERMEYTKAIAREIPLLPGDEQAEVFFAEVIRFFTKRDVAQEYEDIIRIKGYLTALKVIAIKSLDNNPNIAAVVQYITSIEERYDEVIKGGKFTCIGAAIGASTCVQSCTLEKIYTDPSFGKIYSAMNENLFSLNISKTLPLEFHTLVMTKWWEEFECEVIKGFNTNKGIECFKELHDKQVYLVDSSKKHLPHITQDEYNNGLRVVSMPLQLSKNHTYNQRNNVVYSEAGYGNHNGECNTGKTHKVHEKKYTFSGEPFIFTKESRKTSKGPILYLSGPQELAAAENYPAVMYISGDNIHYAGSENHETTFIVHDNTGFSRLEGGLAMAEKNIISLDVDSYKTNIDLNRGDITLYRDASALSSIIDLKNIYNYLSHSTAQQDITTHCKTRYVNAGGGNRGNTVKQGSANCKDEDHEVRVVHKNDVHYRGSKQVIFVVNKNSDNATITVDNNFNTNKNSANIIRLEGLGIERLRIKEAEGYYNLTLLTDDRKAISIKVVDDLKNLVIYTEGNQTIFVQDKSLPDLIRDMYYQKLNRSGEYVDDNVLENSKIKLKAVILKEIDNTEATHWTAKYIADKSNNLGISSQVVVTKHRKKELIEQAVIHDTYDNDIYVDLSASGDFKFGYPFSYIESIKTKDENTTIFGFLDGFKVYLNRNGHKITGYVFDETRSISNIIADGDYQDIVNELNTTIPIKFGDEVLIIGTKGDDILHNDPNYKSHLVGNGGKDRYVIDRNLSDFSIPGVIIYDPNGPAIDMYDLNNKLKDKFKKDIRLTQFFDRSNDIYFDLLEDEKIAMRVYVKQCRLKGVGNIVSPSEDMRNISTMCGFNQELLDVTRNNILSHLGGDNYDHLRHLKNLFNYDEANLNVQDDKGNTPLHLACKNCSYDMVKYLIEKKDARINAKNKDGKTPLDLANECEQSEAKERLIDVFRTAQSELDELLIYNVRHGNLTEVRKFIGQGANVHAQNKHKSTPLNLACFYKKLEIVVYLVKNGANIEDPDGRGNLPLHLASLNGNLDTVKYLVNNCRANLNTADYDGNTALHIAVRNVHLSNEHLSIAKYLVARGADVNARDIIGNTPLHYAAMFGRQEIVEYFISKGAGINIINNQGKTPLDLAKERNFTKMVDVLEKAQEEERPVQRRRRHHHGDHNRHHLSRKPLAIDNDNSATESTSGANKPSSWVNNLFSWAKDSVSGLFSSRAALSEETLNTTSFISQIDAPIDVNGTIMLLDLLIRKVTGQKYISAVDKPVSLLEAQGYAFGITQEFEKIVEQAAKDSKISIHRLNIDFIGIQKEITGKFISGRLDEISGILNSYLEKACPDKSAGCPGRLSPKKFDKFMAVFNNKLDIALNQSISQILQRGNSLSSKDSRAEEQQKSFNLEDKPTSRLDNSSTHGYLTQVRGIS